MVHVLGVRAGVGEALETLVALEGLHAAVQPLVLRKMVLVLERFLAHVALVRALAWKNKVTHEYSFQPCGDSPECSYLWRARELCFPNILSHWSQA